MRNNNLAKQANHAVFMRHINDDASSTSSERYEKDVTVLNRCFDDIERFIARLQHAAAARRELERRRKYVAYQLSMFHFIHTSFPIVFLFLGWARWKFVVGFIPMVKLFYKNRACQLIAVSTEWYQTYSCSLTNTKRILSFSCRYQFTT